MDRADVSQFGVLPTVRVNLGCFNCGINQEMLAKQQHLKSFRRVIAKGVGEQELHICTFCEVGGHKQGLAKSKVTAAELVSDALSHHYKAMAVEAYVVTWQASTEPSDDSSITLTLLGEPEVVEIQSAVEPQLVIMVFRIASAKHPEKHGLLISGVLHIRTPRGIAVKIHPRKWITTQALRTLEDRASTVSSGVSQPTAPVLVLTGDVNLPKSTSDTIVQKMIGEPTVKILL